MKNIKYLLLAAIGVFASCDIKYDGVFDRSAAERITDALNDYQEILIAAPNGWIMDYYAEYPEKRTGGYVLLVSFDAEGFATVACETDVTASGAARVTSTYDLIADQGPVLTFNTYNRLLHQFTEPRGPRDTDGDAGDYEFIIMEASADRVVMKGKKYGNAITLNALPADTDWDEYLKGVINMDMDNYYPIFKVSKDGAEVGVIRQTFDRKLKFMDSSDSEMSRMSIICTPDGFHLYEPVKFFGVVFDELIWDAAEQVFKSPDGSIVLKGEFPAVYYPYENYLKSFSIQWVTTEDNTRSKAVTVVEKKVQKTFEVTNFAVADYDNASITATYDRETSEFKIYPQVLDVTFSGQQVSLMNWLDGGGFNSDMSLSYDGVVSFDDSDKMALTFTSNTVGGPIGILILHGSNSLASYDSTYTQMVWTEQ